MTIDRNDPRWTAYVLGELSPEEQAVIEDRVAQDPEASVFIDEIRDSVSVLQRVQGFENPGLTEEQRNAILEHAVARTPRTRRLKTWSWGAGIAASLLVAFLALRLASVAPQSGDPGLASLVSSPAPGAGAAVVDVPLDRLLPDANTGNAVTSPESQGAGDSAVTGNERGALATDGSGTREAPADRIETAMGDAIEGKVDNNSDSAALASAFEALHPDIAGTQEAPAPTVPRAPASAQQAPGGQVSGVIGGALRSAEAAQAVAEFVGQDALRVNTFAEAAPPPTARPVRPAPGAFPDRGRSRFNTEEYDRITDNPFRLVSEEPLSTFSADVDTASYANVRRFLNQRSLPPPDAVRIEEMVNYFDYDYAPPRDGRPVRVNAEVASAPWAPAHRLVRIGIQGQELARNERAASNLVFLIDVSGSMNEPDKLPLLVNGMKLLVGQLGENDRVAIVVYAGATGLVLDSTPGFRAERILSALERLRAGGSTNGGAGIQLAYDVAVRNFIDGGINRVILATDGDFNVGITNTGDLTRLIEEEARTGVFLSVLGFGTGNYNDQGLEALADRGNGNYAYIDSMREARKVLVEEIGSTLVTIARDVKFQVEFNPARVGAYRLIGYENRALENQDFNNDAVDAGEIGAGHTVTALYEIIPAGAQTDVPGVDPLRYQAPLIGTAASASGELLLVRVRYKDPDGGASQLIEAPLVDRGESFEEASPDFRFASAVAGFGMILRDSPYRGSATLDWVLDAAQSSRGQDTGEYRRQFVELVRLARAIQDFGGRE